MGGRACKAAEYAFGLCDAICRGMSRQKSYDRTGKVCSGNMRSNQIKSIISSMKQWQDEDFQIPIGSGSGLARATDEAAKAEELPDEDGPDHSKYRNPSAGNLVTRKCGNQKNKIRESRMTNSSFTALTNGHVLLLCSQMRVHHTRLPEVSSRALYIRPRFYCSGSMILARSKLWLQNGASTPT